MKNLKHFGPVVIWCAVIFYLSSLQSVPSPEDTVLNVVLKKIAHITEYAILYALAYRAVNESTLQKKHYFWPLFFVIFYASTDEFHQSFVLGRHARFYDIGFDTFGALLVPWSRRRSNFTHAGKKI